MLSDVTISFANHTVTLPGVSMLVGIVVIVALWGISVAIASARRTQRQTNDAAEVLGVQLERMGDALERIAKQNAARQSRLQHHAALAGERRATARATPDGPAQSAVSPVNEIGRTQSVDQKSVMGALRRAAVATTPPAPSRMAPGAQAANGAPVTDDHRADTNADERHRPIPLAMFGR
jgi:hypothetical protein